MANTDDIFGTTASINSSGALDVVAAEELRRVQQEKATLEASASAGSRAEAAFIPPSQADFEQQYFQKQIDNKNYDVFNKKPDVLDRIVAQAYQEEVQRARTSFQASSSSSAAALALPTISSPIPTPSSNGPVAPSNAGILYNQQNALVRGFGSDYAQYAQSFVEPLSTPQMEEYLPPRSPAVSNNIVRWAGPGRSAFPQVITSASPALISAYPAIIGEEDSHGGPHQRTRQGQTGDPAGQDYEWESSNQRNESAGRDAGEDDSASSASAPGFAGGAGGAARPEAMPGAANPLWGRLRGLGAHALANMKEDWEDPSGYGKLNYGYALQQVGQETNQYYEKTQAGQYLTPEQKSTAAAGFLPGAGALAGVAIGSMIAPGVGSWVGGMVGGGVATAAQGIIGANDERSQTVREAAERLAASLGSASESVGSFKSQIESTGASVQQVSQGLSALQATGPGVGAGAIAGVGRSALSEGEYYGADTAATSKFLASSPALAPLAQQYRTNGELSRQSFQSIAQLALAEGDTSEFNTAQMQASRATLNNDSQYQSLAKNQQVNASSWGNQVNHWATEAGHHLGFQWLGMSDEDPIVQDQLALDRRKAQVDAQSGLDAKKYTDEYASINAGRQGLIDAGLNVKIDQTGLAIAEAGGAGAAEMRRLAPGINASLDAATAGDQTIITTDTGLMIGLTTASDPTGSIRTSYQTLINQARADQVQNPLAKAQLARSVFDTGLQEDESAYGLTLTTAQSGLTRSLLSGRRYDQLAGDENGIVSSETGRANQLRRSAENPLVRPAERSQMLAQADSLETGAAVQQHDFRQNIYRQAVVQDDLGVGRAGLQVEQARAFGTEASVYGAQGQEADALRAKMAELTRQLAAGGNTADETAEKMREITQAGGQLNSVLAQQRDERLAAQQSVASSQFQQDTAGLNRQVQLGGSGAVNFDTINADFQGKFHADQAAIDAYKPGDPRRNAAQAKLATDQAESREYEGGLTRYAPSAQTGIQGLTVEDETERARHAFQREMLMPYRTGDPESSPLTRGLGLEKALDKSAAFIDTQEQAATAYRSQQQNKVGADGKPLWDGLAEEGYKQQMLGFHEQKDSLLDQRAQVEHDRMWEEDRRLPEMIAGGGGLTGNSVLAVPQAALSSFFNPNERDGSWGRSLMPRGGSVPGSMPGDAFEGFQQHLFHQSAGGQHGPITAGTPTSALVTAIQDAAHQSGGTQQVSLLQLIYAVLTRIESGGRVTPPPPGGPVRTSGGSSTQAIRQNFNTNRPSLR